LGSVKKQIREGKSQIGLDKQTSSEYGLIIDGKSLAFALDKSLEKSFLELATLCDSVICCRSSPKQKALVSFSPLLEGFVLHFSFQWTVCN